MLKRALLTYAKLEKLTTPRLKAYKCRLYKVHESNHINYGNIPSGNHVSKESDEWKNTLADVKEILATRKHVD